MTLDELLQQAKEKSDAATPGTWTVDEYGQFMVGGIEVPETDANRDFVTFACTALPLLVKIVEACSSCNPIVKDMIEQLIEKEMKP